METQSKAIARRLGIQGWCFRELKGGNAELIGALKECGVSALEPCGVQIDPVKVSRLDCENYVEEFRSQGITLSSFGVYEVGEDEAEARRVFEFAHLADFETIGVDLRGAKSLEIVEKLCDEYAKKVAIHNHGRRHRLGSVAQLEELFRKASPHVGLCLDSGWFLDSGEDPVKMAERFRDRLYGIHIKDFVFDRAGRPIDVVAGEGNLSLDALMAFLVEADFGGYITIEYEGDADNPIPALRRCVDAVRTSLNRL